jgi:hypothetical protein
VEKIFRCGAEQKAPDLALEIPGAHSLAPRVVVKRLVAGGHQLTPFHAPDRVIDRDVAVIRLRRSGDRVAWRGCRRCHRQGDRVLAIGRLVRTEPSPPVLVALQAVVTLVAIAGGCAGARVEEDFPAGSSCCSWVDWLRGSYG